MSDDERKVPRSRIIISYLADYVIIIGFAIGFFIIGNVAPYTQHFSLDNISLQYPFAKHERVPIWMACAISIGAPVVVIFIYTMFLDGLFSHSKSETGRKRLGRYSVKERLWQFNCGILGLLLAQSSAFVITNALKNACGKPRPDLIDRCQPKAGSHDATPYGLSDVRICTQKDMAILNDGFRSFPSGHSSSSFAGLFFLTLYLSGKLHVMDNRGEVWKTIFVASPLVGACLIAISRIMDARHHPFDVISGSMLGILCGWVAYRQYFPPLSDYASKGRAYPVRQWGSQPLPRKPRPVRAHSDEVKLVSDYSDNASPQDLECGREADVGDNTLSPMRYRPASNANLSPASATHERSLSSQVRAVVRQASDSQYSRATDADTSMLYNRIPNEYEMQPTLQGPGVSRNNTVLSDATSDIAGGRDLVGTTYSPYRGAPTVRGVSTIAESERPTSRDTATQPREGY